MRARLLRASPPGRSRDLLEAAFDRAEQFARSPNTSLAANHIPRAISEAAASLGLSEPSPDDVRELTLRTVLPFAERVFRHQMLDWAANIADRRGWRFVLFGRDWERHPRFARFTRGPLDHGDALRDIYASSRVHLHGSLQTSLHQRVFECLLSGGLPLCRATFADIRACAVGALATVYERLNVTAPLSAESFRHHFFQRLDMHPEFRALAHALPSLGATMTAGEILWGNNTKDLNDPYARRLASPLFVLGDRPRPMFHDEASLESLLTLAIESPSWRHATVEGSRMRALETHSYAAFARDLVSALDQ